MDLRAEALTSWPDDGMNTVGSFGAHPGGTPPLPPPASPGTHTAGPRHPASTPLLPHAWPATTGPGHPPDQRLWRADLLATPDPPVVRVAGSM